METDQEGIAAPPGSEGVPLYVRVAASLRTRIYDGEWPVGARLPSFEKLAERYGVALTTVRKAIEMLSAQRLVVSARGCGTTVTARTRDLAQRDLRLAISDPLSLPADHRIDVQSSVRVDTLPEELRGNHRVASGYQRVSKTQSVGPTPYAALDIYIASALFERFPPGAEYRHKLSQLLRDDAGTLIVRSRQEITVTHSDQRIADLLRYPVAAPLVRVRRWRQTADGTVVYAGIVLYRSDLFVWDTTHEEVGEYHYATHVVPDIRPAE